MKVSDRQWSVGDKLIVRDKGHALDGQPCEVKATGALGLTLKVAYLDPTRGDVDALVWLSSDCGVELVAFKLPPITEQPTIERRAVKLAEVYQQAFAAVDKTLPERMWKASDPANVRQIAHEIAMLLVKRELEAGDG